MIQKVCQDDEVAEQSLREMQQSLEAYASVCDGEQELTGDAKVFASQVEQTTQGDMATLMQDVVSHEQNAEERQNIYASYYNTENTELDL